MCDGMDVCRVVTTGGGAVKDWWGCYNKKIDRGKVWYDDMMVKII